jgi:hypothetical protein
MARIIATGSMLARRLRVDSDSPSASLAARLTPR